MEYIGPAAAGAGAAIKFLEFTFKVQNTSQQATDYLHLAELVQGDLNEAIRLRNTHSRSLDPPSLSRIDTIIHSTGRALTGVAALVEDCRMDMKEKGRVGMGNKLAWALKDSQEMATKQVYLVACQQSLLNIITELKGVAGRETAGGLPTYGGLHYDEDERERLMIALTHKHTVRRPRGRSTGAEGEQQGRPPLTPPLSFSQQSSPPIPEHSPYDPPPIPPRPAAYTYTNNLYPPPPSYGYSQRTQSAPPEPSQPPQPQYRGLGVELGYGGEEDDVDTAQAVWLARKMSQEKKRRGGR